MRLKRAFTALCLMAFAPQARADSPLSGRVVVIDAGHGVLNYEGRVINSGKKTGSGTAEHVLTMQMVDRLGKKLREQGARVLYTRTKADYWRQAYSAAEDNRTRALFANEVGAEALVSIHCDWHPRSKVSGVTTLYEKPNSRRLGELIQRKMVSSLKAKDRKLVQDTFTILDYSEVPAVIVETGFMSHRSESKKLKTAAYQDKVAKALTDALKNYFSERPIR